LREPQKNKKRAQIVIATKCPESLTAADYFVAEKNQGILPHQELFFTSYGYKSLLPVFQENNPVKKESIARLKKESYSVVLLAGLANPTGLIRYLSTYLSDMHPLLYPDHYSFKRKDINTLLETFRKMDNPHKIIITSEKDAMRLLDNPHIPKELKPFIYYLPIEVIFNFNGEESFIQKIENHVTNFTRNRILA
jgi:tetraacyldisaccharide 4'-kinase